MSYNGPLAQLAEQIPLKDKVPGSTPGRPKKSLKFFKKFLTGFLEIVS